ncbi:MAG TPA: F0F1 ATP synthase subunit epsilon [bacterium]
MLPKKIKFEIITPHQKVYSKEVDGVVLPGHDGYFGVLPGHTPYLASLRVGEIKVEVDKKEVFLATSGGVVEVFPDAIAVLAETAEPATTIDLKRAQAARDRALNRLKEGRKSADMARAQASLARALNRIGVASKV